MCQTGSRTARISLRIARKRPTILLYYSRIRLGILEYMDREKFPVVITVLGKGANSDHLVMPVTEFIIRMETFFVEYIEVV